MNDAQQRSRLRQYAISNTSHFYLGGGGGGGGGGGRGGGGGAYLRYTLLYFTQWKYCALLHACGSQHTCMDALNYSEPSFNAI